MDRVRNPIKYLYTEQCGYQCDWCIARFCHVEEQRNFKDGFEFALEWAKDKGHDSVIITGGDPLRERIVGVTDTVRQILDNDMVPILEGNAGDKDLLFSALGIIKPSIFILGQSGDCENPMSLLGGYKVHGVKYYLQRLYNSGVTDTLPEYMARAKRRGWDGIIFRPFMRVTGQLEMPVQMPIEIATEGIRHGLEIQWHPHDKYIGQTVLKWHGDDEVAVGLVKRRQDGER